MQQLDQKQREALAWAFPISVATHVIVVALLIFGLPQTLSKPQPEQAISVELVPPPKPVDKPKPPPPQQAAPPPTPEPAPEPQKKVEMKAPPPGEAGAGQSPLPTMQPVVQFGEEDAGPRKSTEGDSAESGAQASAAEADPAKPDKPVAKPVKPATNQAQVALVEDPKAEKAKQPDDPAKASKEGPLAKAKTLFSRSVTDNPVATTAMGKMPRDVRGGALCGTELRAQLIHASPPHFPDILPSLRLTRGVVIDVNAAFHADGTWRAVSFRCTVDAQATKVESFAFAIGALIPRTEWQRLGLPSQ